MANVFKGVTASTFQWQQSFNFSHETNASFTFINAGDSLSYQLTIYI